MKRLDDLYPNWIVILAGILIGPAVVVIGYGIAVLLAAAWLYDFIGPLAAGSATAFFAFTVLRIWAEEKPDADH
jgi:hypothetical protein